MNVLIVTPVYPPDIGGPSLQSLEIAQALKRHGHRPTVLTTRGGRVPSGDFEVICAPVRGGSKIVRNLKLLRDISTVLARVKPDLVHMQTCEGALPLVIAGAARARGIPRLVKLSADFAWVRLNRDADQGIPVERLHSSSLEARAYTVLQKKVLEQYNLLWATSPFMEEMARQTYGIPRHRLFALPNLVDLSSSMGVSAGVREQETPTVLTALLVARLVPFKGVEVALQALALLNDVPLRLRIVGEGARPYVQSLQQLVQQLGLQQRVEFAGAIAPTQIGVEYRAADLFVLPSLYESFGIAFVQAMAAGLPVVGTQVGGIPSVVTHGETGLLVPPRDPQALAATLRKLANAPELRRHLGDAARGACLRFDLERRFPDLLAMYERTLLLGQA